MSAGLPVEVRDTEYSVSRLTRLGTSTGLIAEQAAGRLRYGWPGRLTVDAAACCSVVAMTRALRLTNFGQEPARHLLRHISRGARHCSCGGLAHHPAVRGCQRNTVQTCCSRDVLLQPPGGGSLLSTFALVSAGCLHLGLLLRSDTT